MDEHIPDTGMDLINSREFIYSYREVSNHNSAVSHASRDIFRTLG